MKRICKMCVWLELVAMAFSSTALAQQAQELEDGLPASAIVLSSPHDYQVFQRSSRLSGKILIRGKASIPADCVEVRLTGSSLLGPLSGKWKRVGFSRSPGEFHAAIAIAAGGFYRMQVRLLQRTKTVAETEVAHVGMGEVFIVAGQSNSTNYGETLQTIQSGMVSAWSTRSWQIADDPQPGVQDHSKKGSFIPPFGDALYGRIHVPIGIASVGHGSTSIRQWLPAGDRVEAMPTMTKFIVKDDSGALVSDGILFNGMTQCMQQFGEHGFRALLWHQGESDANQPPEHQISAATYQKMVMRVIRASRQRAGWNFPWFVAEATYHSPSDTSTPAFEQAQQSLWASGIAFAGPNTDVLGAPYRQNNGKGVHMNDAGLKAHGAMWASIVEQYIESALTSK
jgi:hypothetical protein